MRVPSYSCVEKLKLCCVDDIDDTPYNRSLAENPLKTEGMEYIAQALAGIGPDPETAFMFACHALACIFATAFESACIKVTQNILHADGECPLFTLNIKNTQVIRIPLCLQDTRLLKEIVSEDNPLLFPPREVACKLLSTVWSCLACLGGCALLTRTAQMPIGNASRHRKHDGLLEGPTRQAMYDALSCPDFSYSHSAIMCVR